MSFLAWIFPLLKPYYLESNEYLYFEGDEIHSIYFLKVGNCGFVLPKFDNTKYVNVKLGNNFGIEDIVGSIIKNEDVTQEDWMCHKDKLLRQFTVLGEDKRQTYLALSISDLNRMQLEF
jgi:CRP-like cAMP-binding protein